jgi:hypothetical protein
LGKANRLPGAAQRALITNGGQAVVAGRINAHKSEYAYHPGQH